MTTAQAPQAPIRVLIADDQMMVRQGFTVLLDAEQGIEVVGQAVDGLDAVAKVAELAPDVVLMDIRMPELGGIEATRRITGSDGSTVKVLVLTTFDLDEYVYEALRAGASGFLLKDASADELAHAVRVVAAGDALLSPNITKRVDGPLDDLDLVSLGDGHPLERLEQLVQSQLVVLFGHVDPDGLYDGHPGVPPRLPRRRLEPRITTIRTVVRTRPWREPRLQAAPASHLSPAIASASTSAR
ncbi:response regulator transcription factor [Streptomyces sp. NPDC059909]|uniref:response regulator n=1 Tax=Streptomyces sp. NPDC059909 TaxID=3346998 RepID=UPI003663B1F2